MALVEGSVEALIESASRRGNIPNSQMTYLLEDFLNIAQEELMAYALPVLHARREDYYLEELFFDINNPDIMVGSDADPNNTIKNIGWRIPPYAMASTVRDVQAVSSGGSYYNLGRINVDDVPNSVSQGWYFYGNYIIYQQNTNGSVAAPVGIRCIVHVKPSRLIPSNVAYTDLVDETEYYSVSQACRVVQVVSPTNVIVNIAVTIGANGYVDIIAGTPGYEVKNRLVPILLAPIATTDLILQATPPVPIKVGDWLAFPGTTPLVPLPLEMHALLAQRMVVKFLEAQGDQEQLAQARNSLQEMVLQIPLLIQPRAEGKPRKIAPRMGLWRRWRW